MDQLPSHCWIILRYPKPAMPPWQFILARRDDTLAANVTFLFTNSQLAEDFLSESKLKHSAIKEVDRKTLAYTLRKVSPGVSYVIIDPRGNAERAATAPIGDVIEYLQRENPPNSAS